MRKRTAYTLVKNMDTETAIGDSIHDEFHRSTVSIGAVTTDTATTDMIPVSLDDGEISINVDGSICKDVSKDLSNDLSKDVSKNGVNNKRGIASDAVNGACCCLRIGQTIMNVVSIVLGICILVGGCLLAYSGVTTQVPILNFVFYVFAAINLIGGVYIIFRTFSLASAIAALSKVNDEFQKTQDELEKTQDELEGTNKKLIVTNGELLKTNIELSKTNDKLLKTNSELAQTNEDLMSTAEKLNAVNTQLVKTSEDLNGDVKDLRKLNNTLSDDLANLRIEVEGLNVVRTQLDEDVAKLSKLNAGLATANVEMAKGVTELRGTIAAEREENEKLRGEINTLNDSNTRLQALNELLDHNIANLHLQLEKFMSDIGMMEKQIEGVKHERGELALSNEKLRQAITALASANDASLDVGKLIKDVLEDMEKQRDGLKSEREAMERFALGLTSSIYAEMDLNGDGVIDKSEQTAWLTRHKKQ